MAPRYNTDTRSDGDHNKLRALTSLTHPSLHQTFLSFVSRKHIMAAPAPPASPAPTDAYQWRESVLSTRSLSYMSTADALEGSGPQSPRLNRNSSCFNTPVRRNTLMSISSLGEGAYDSDTDGGLEIAQRDRVQIPAFTLPASIADSPLFRLPLELRQLIYSYALCSTSPEIPWPAQRQTITITAPLLRTCKAIYGESAEVLYTLNNLSFAHPSDCNMFRHALASPYAELLPHFTLRIRAQDTRLWTSYFNSNAAARSLARDFPSLRELTIRFKGVRYQVQFSEEQNALTWLKDPKLQEIILSVRKCITTVKILLAVKLPKEVLDRLDQTDKRKETDNGFQAMYRRYAWLSGCYIRVEPIVADTPDAV